jgi:hypothetical protein
MTEIIIPQDDWHTALCSEIRRAPLNATIVVNTEKKAELGRIAAGGDRLNRPDITFEVREHNAPSTKRVAGPSI